MLCQRRDTRGDGLAAAAPAADGDGMSIGLGRLLEFPLARRQRALAARPHLSKKEFIDQTASTDLGRAAAALLWDKLVVLKLCDEFNPYPSDDLLKVYGLAEEDLDIDVVLDILNGLNCRIPDQATIDAIGPIDTPRDLIRLVEASGLDR